MDGGRKLWYLEEHANSAGKEPESNPEPATGPTTEAAVTPLSLHPISISQHRKVRLNRTALTLVYEVKLRLYSIPFSGEAHVVKHALLLKKKKRLNICENFSKR